MSKKASKKSIQQLQKVIDFLGSNGGRIEVKDSGTYWNLNVEVIPSGTNEKLVTIGVYKNFYGDILFDPCFSLTVSTIGDTICNAEITQYISCLPTGIFRIESDDIMYSSCCPPEKDMYGLKKRFSSFMNYVTSAPYLTSPLRLEKYENLC